MRWKILAVLFVTRMSFGFQFAAIGAIGPVYMDRFHIDAVGLGTLIGLYVAPAILVAIPGGTIAGLIGDKRLVIAGLCAMALGTVIALVFDSLAGNSVGRLIAGIGGVFLNVTMTKMVADWFSGRELTTAMAIFINSFPAGVASSLALVPVLVAAGGLMMANLAFLAYVAACIALMAFLYQAPGAADASRNRWGIFPRGDALGAIIWAGAGWGMFNATLAVIFSFGPTNLVERGVPLVEASAATSIVIWLIMIAGFCGGFVADRTGRPVTLIVVSAIFGGAGLIWFTETQSYIWAIIYLGLVIGLPSGAYVSLAARALQPQERAMGMGVFYTVYYIVYAIAPPVAGIASKVWGSAAGAFYLGAAELVVAVGCVALAIRIIRRIEFRLRSG